MSKFSKILDDSLKDTPTLIREESNCSPRILIKPKEKIKVIRGLNISVSHRNKVLRVLVILNRI